MNYRERTERMIYLLELIEKSRCRNLDSIAERFDCSRRTIERMISLLNEEGNNITYCKKSRVYKNH